MTASQRSTPKRKRGSQNILARPPSTFHSSSDQTFVPRKKLNRKTNHHPPSTAFVPRKKLKRKTNALTIFNLSAAAQSSIFNLQPVNHSFLEKS
jgi:hypothetical protein